MLVWRFPDGRLNTPPAGRESEHVMNWLFKEEPANYSYDAFVKDGRTTWSGVKNPLAQKHLRGVKKGDRIFYYHTGKEKAVVGVARAATDAYPDPADKLGKAVVVDVVPVRKLRRPVTLSEIKADRAFRAFPLTRLPRLSVMPVSEAEWAGVLKRGGG
jgi:predicted RNA-binding protein with PUA-like domain